MCQSFQLNNCIISIHERALRFVYRDQAFSRRGTLEKEKLVPVHEENKFQTQITKSLKTSEKGQN